METFEVIFGKQTSKKHKTFEDDGTLIVDREKKTATLKSLDGKIQNVELNFRENVEEGDRIDIGNKLVEIVRKLSDADCENKTPKQEVSLAPKPRPALTSKHPIRRGFLNPVKTQKRAAESDDDRAETETYIVTIGKQSAKIHKTFEDDGILIFNKKSRSLLLKSNIDKTLNEMTCFNSEIEIGMRIEIGNRLVEVIEKVGAENPKPFSVPLTSRPKSIPVPTHSRSKSPPRKKFKPPAVVNRDLNVTVQPLMINSPGPSGSKSFINQSPVISSSSLSSTRTSSKSKYEEFMELESEAPKTPPFYLPDPDYDHQWKFNEYKKPLSKVVVPECVASVLRPHQKEGVTFLYKCVMGFNVINDENYFGAILADEMGLGKTLQCIALIYTLLKAGPYSQNVAKRVLIVAPSGLLGNWDKEILKWLQNERVFTLIVDGKKNTISDFRKSAHIPIMLISYEMFLKHENHMKEINFDLMICDEAHRLKNTDLKLTSSLNELECRRRVLLTGTPFQNDMREFYALINFVNPNVLGSYHEFKSKYENPIVQSQQPGVLPQFRELGQQRAKELNDLTSKFILRRTQEIIQKYLPKKQEVIVFVRPRKIQQDLIRKLLTIYENQQFEKVEVLEKNLLPLELIVLLKKLCNHPKLLSVKQNAREKEILRHLDIAVNDYHPKYSGKVWILVELLLQLIEKREKIVIISYYTQTLDMLEAICGKFNFKFIRMDGSTKSSDRTKIVKKFNDPNDDSFVFLLSAKSGGVGLNLIGASRLILFDNDWNPSNDLQALARIYREGQVRDTYIYRFITSGTIEEKIYQRQITKTALSGYVVDSKQSSSKMKFSDAELKDLFGTENLYFDSCNTHEIIKCNCNGLGVLPQNSQSSIEFETESSHEEDEDEDDEDYSPFQIRLDDNKKKPKEKKVSSDLKMHELMKWEHHNFPVSDDLLDELCLKTCGEFINFIFRNQTENVDT